MITSNPIFVVDVNVIIHLEKAGLLDELTNDKRVRIVDLVLYEEYEYKENNASCKVRQIKQLHLDENQILEAANMNLLKPRNSVFDYYNFIAARDNNGILLTGDFKLKKYIGENIEVHGAIWYAMKLREENIIDDQKLKEVYKIWLEDEKVFIPDEKLVELILQLDDKSC